MLFEFFAAEEKRLKQLFPPQDTWADKILKKKKNRLCYKNIE